MPEPTGVPARCPRASSHPASDPPLPVRRPAASLAFQWVAAAAAFGLLLAPVRAQDTSRRLERSLRLADPTYRLRAEADLTFSESLELDYGGFFTFNYLTLNDTDDNSRGLMQYETTLYGRASIGGDGGGHTVFGRARFRYRDFTPGDSFDGKGDRWSEPFLDRYWYEFDLRRALGGADGTDPTNLNFNMRIGRQFVDWGAGLALSENLYAVRPALQIGDRWTIEGLAGVTPPDESVVDFDASREDFDKHTLRGFFGGLVRYTTPRNTSFYGYALHMPDYNTDKTPRLPLGGDVQFDYTATYLGAGVSGSAGANLLYLGELVYETGESKTDPLFGFQQFEDISAFAGRAQFTYLFRDQNQSRLELEALFATGDSDRLATTDTVGGNRPGTDDTAFNSLGFANTGLSFAPSLSNIVTVRAGASTFPARSINAVRNLQIGADVLLFNKFDDDAPIDEPTDLGNGYLGIETDLFLNYRITSDLAVNLRYGVFFPGSTLQDNDTRHFFLVGFTLSF